MFNDRIERLAELEGKASHANWEIGLASKFICSRDKDTGIFHSVGDINTIDDSRLICALRNDALPLLREMAQALSEAQAENERLRDGIGRALELMESKENLIEDGHPFSEWFYCILGLLKDDN